MLSLLTVRCQREIEIVLKTLGQDSNLQPQQSDRACREKQFTTADIQVMEKNFGSEACKQRRTGRVAI